MPLTLRSICLASCVVLFGSAARADVVKLVVEKRVAFASQGRPYEKLTGRFYGELDARHPLNAVITDMEE